MNYRDKFNELGIPENDGPWWVEWVWPHGGASWNGPYATRAEAETFIAVVNAKNEDPPPGTLIRSDESPGITWHARRRNSPAA